MVTYSEKVAIPADTSFCRGILYQTIISQAMEPYTPEVQEHFSDVTVALSVTDEAAEALLSLSDSAFEFQEETESSDCLDGTILDLDDLLTEEQEPVKLVIRMDLSLSLSRMSPY